MLGDHHVKKEERPLAQSIKVWKIHRHPDYQSKTFTNDLAIIELKKQVCWSSYKMPICLPDKDPPSIVNSTVTAAGWGWTAESSKGKYFTVSRND